MFTETLWTEWFQREAKNYKLVDGKKIFLKKGYTHFDQKIWFPSEFPSLKTLLKNNLKSLNPHTKKFAFHGFAPFLKQILKTPRYRYQEDEGDYDLEFKLRPICFASHLDSLIYGFYAFGLNKKYQTYIKDKAFDQCVLAYRSDTGKSNIQYSKEVFDWIKRYIKEFGECTVIALDIKGYFDNIQHKILKEKWVKVWGDPQLPEDQFKVFKTLTSYSYVRRNKIFSKYNIDERQLKKDGKFPATLFDFVPGQTIQEKYDRLKGDKIIVDNRISLKNPEPKGIPQGSSMSTLLSNIYLVDYDQEMQEWAEKYACIYRRYCDDIILICPTKHANGFKKKAIDDIYFNYGLSIQDAKAETIDFMPNLKGVVRSFRRRKDRPDRPAVLTKNSQKALYKNLQYLGFEFNGQHVYIRGTSLSRYFRKMKAREDKTVHMAYGGAREGGKIYRYQLYERYSHYGERNFVSYAKKAASKRYQVSKGVWMDGHNSSKIREQLSQHMLILDATLEKKNLQRHNYKLVKGKNPHLKKI